MRRRERACCCRRWRRAKDTRAVGPAEHTGGRAFPRTTPSGQHIARGCDGRAEWRSPRTLPAFWWWTWWWRRMPSRLREVWSWCPSSRFCSVAAPAVLARPGRARQAREFRAGSQLEGRDSLGTVPRNGLERALPSSPSSPSWHGKRSALSGASSRTGLLGRQLGKQKAWWCFDVLQAFESRGGSITSQYPTSLSPRPRPTLCIRRPREHVQRGKPSRVKAQLEVETRAGWSWPAGVLGL
jgi:hypothetical protein